MPRREMKNSSADTLSPASSSYPLTLESDKAVADRFMYGRADLVLPDYKLFKFRCEVDYVEVSVKVNKPTNFMTVREKLDCGYVQALDEGPGRAATQFAIRFDDPASRAHLLTALEPLRIHANGFAEPPRLVKIEVALDAYSRNQDNFALLVMTSRFFRFGAEICSDNLRLAKFAGGVEWAENPARFSLLLSRGYEVLVGDEDADIAQRIYLKTTDQSGNVHLPVQEHRARREITLAGIELEAANVAFPSRLLSSVVPWKFEALTKWFRFRKLRTGLTESPMQRIIADRRVLQGVRNEDRPKRRVYDRRVLADTALNELARDQLRELSRRFSS